MKTILFFCLFFFTALLKGADQTALRFRYSEGVRIFNFSVFENADEDEGTTVHIRYSVAFDERYECIMPGKEMTYVIGDDVYTRLFDIEIIYCKDSAGVISGAWFIATRQQTYRDKRWVDSRTF